MVPGTSFCMLYNSTETLICLIQKMTPHWWNALHTTLVARFYSPLKEVLRELSTYKSQVNWLFMTKYSLFLFIASLSCPVYLRPSIKRNIHIKENFLNTVDNVIQQQNMWDYLKYSYSVKCLGLFLVGHYSVSCTPIHSPTMPQTLRSSKLLS